MVLGAVVLVGAAIGSGPGDEINLSRHPWSAPTGDAIAAGGSIGLINENCVASEIIPSPVATMQFDSTAALPGGDPGACNAVGAQTMQNDVWFEWTATFSGTLTANLDSLDGRPVILQSFRSSCSGLVLLGCAADGAGSAQESFPVLFGNTYRFQCGDPGLAPAGGPTCLSIFAVPDNDDCAGAFLFGNPTADHTFDCSSATEGLPLSTCGSGSAAGVQNDVWFRWTAPRSGPLLVRLDAIDAFDPLLQVFSGACGVLVNEGCSSGTGSVELEVTAQAGQEFFFQCGAAGNTPSGGRARIRVRQREDCASAEFIETLPFSTTYDSSLLGADAPPGTCNDPSAPAMQNDAWFAWTATEDCEARITVTDLDDYDLVGAIYAGVCGFLTELVCLDITEPFDGFFDAEENVTYYFQFGSRGLASGGGLTRFDLSCLADDQDCANAGELECAVETPINLASGRSDAGDAPIPCAGAAPTGSRWRSFVALGADATLTVSTLEQGADDALIAVYSGQCGALTPLACASTPSGGPLPSLQVSGLVAGQTYFVQLASATPAGARTYGLRLDFDALPSCPPDALLENEPCGEAFNDGCNMPVPATTPLELGRAVCAHGNFDPDALVRDTDFFEFTINATTRVRWQVFAEFPAQVAVLDPDGACAATIYANLTTPACQQIEVDLELPPGTYWTFVGVEFFTRRIECAEDAGGRYVASVTLAPTCTGDADGDAAVDFGDITAVLANWLVDYRPFPGTGPGDANGDGLVDFSDVTAVLANWLVACP